MFHAVIPPSPRPLVPSHPLVRPRLLRNPPNTPFSSPPCGPPPIPPLTLDETAYARRCALFAVVAAVPAFARDRRQTLQEMLNGAYGPAMYCCTQFLASTPFTLVSAVVYQSIFHWLVRRCANILIGWPFFAPAASRCCLSLRTGGKENR